ncbi:hypothetical protein SDC9_165079 [bioreactor metagenome]|uniref:Uncharacterized protein n=1 Tax=bioreactor metagenome TaxID=1076179 RepID=A0A645G0S6_9ZZZZ
MAYRQLKAHLVVALAGAAVDYCVGVFLFGNFYQPLCYKRTRERGAEQVAVLVDSSGLHRWDNIIVDEFIGQVLNIELGRSGLKRALFKSDKLLRLPDVAGHGDDLAVVVMLLEPWNKNRRIESS